MIFGTDGLRARMGRAPLDQATICKLSQVLADWMGAGAEVVVGHDTRASTAEVFAWLISAWRDIAVSNLGVVTTPMVAYETKARGARLGVMITASHNPAEDNGLKFFDSNGLKIPYDLAVDWSDQVEAAGSFTASASSGAAAVTICKPLHYQNLIVKHFPAGSLTGLRIGFDLANGAGYQWGLKLARATGLEVKALGCRPSGANINDGVGALHPQKLLEKVKAENLDAGFALDGDGDRLIVVDQQGVLHGDCTLYALKEAMQAEGVGQHTLVGTILCGMGLEKCLQSEGVSLIRTPVGDQHVLRQLIEKNLTLGGEPSGHLIQGDLFPAGDGLLAMLRLLRALKQRPDLLKTARERVPLYPTFERAYKVGRKPPLETVPGLQDQLATLQQRLGRQGRLIVRYSGTEAKIRVFLEAVQLEPYQSDLQKLEQIIKEKLV